MYLQTFLIIYPNNSPVSVVNANGVSSNGENQGQTLQSQNIVSYDQSQNGLQWPNVGNGGFSQQANKDMGVSSSNINTLSTNEEETYVCKICNKEFKRKANLQRHSKTHSGEKPFSCNVCGKSFSYKEYLPIHARLHNGEKPHVCEICNTSFRLRDTLKRHLLLHTGEKPFVCTICKKAFTTNGALKLHSAVHSAEKPHTCDVCKKSFKLKMHLREHMLFHSGEKPHVCKICQKAFTKKRSMELHMTIHSEEKPFVCNICNKSFRIKEYLRLHILHHSEDKPHVCKYCKKSFAVKKHLQLHVLIHTGEKAHVCSLCNKSFTVKGNLKKHFLTHREERSQGCSICKTSFTEDEYFRKLDNSDDNEEDQYACESCYVDVSSKRTSETELQLSSDGELNLISEQSGIENNVAPDSNKESNKNVKDTNTKEKDFENTVIPFMPEHFMNSKDVSPDSNQELQDINKGEEKATCDKGGHNKDQEELCVAIKEEQDADFGEVIYCDALEEHDIKYEHPYM